MKKIFLVLTPLFLLFGCKSTIRLENDIEKYLSQDFEILEKIKGDLNLDGNEDWIYALSKDISEDEQERIILIYFQNSTSRTIRKLINSNIIWSKGLGGFCCPDPFSGISVEEGQLAVSHMYGACSRTSSSAVFSYNVEKDDLYFSHLSIYDFYACGESDDFQEKSYEVTNDILQKISFSEYQGEADSEDREHYFIKVE